MTATVTAFSTGASSTPLEAERRLLVYGYGNPGRQDDGLGVLFAERCEQVFAGRAGFQVETNYQLNIEDAELISRFREVVFADAALPETLPNGAQIEAGDEEAGDEEAGFLFYRITAGGTISFSTHAMDPESVLGLCDELYGRTPDCRVMRITGHAWEFNAEPSPRARENLENAWRFFTKYVEDL